MMKTRYPSFSRRIPGLAHRALPAVHALEPLGVRWAGHFAGSQALGDKDCTFGQGNPENALAFMVLWILIKNVSIS